MEGRQSAGTRLSEAVAAALGVAISASGASNVTLLRGKNVINQIYTYIYNFNINVLTLDKCE